MLWPLPGGAAVLAKRSELLRGEGLLQYGTLLCAACAAHAEQRRTRVATALRVQELLAPGRGAPGWSAGQLRLSSSAFLPPLFVPELREAVDGASALTLPVLTATSPGHSPATPRTCGGCPRWEPSAWRASSKRPAGLEPRGAKILERSFVNRLSLCSRFAAGWHRRRSRGLCRQHGGSSCGAGRPRCPCSHDVPPAGRLRTDQSRGRTGEIRRGFALGVGSAVSLLWGCSAGLEPGVELGLHV